ncbi:uncharacterized protein EI97DRAFT_453603 [Westerdykella ornata]|uniref:TORC1 subunit TCO89 domain-containing protein n=1 Tax=Westerdykella ornata TaxID=318751 RepID=A0A6A6J6F6_WESOR|nr:uncharacterized protein EI97DRAFT_453603 [Westerdykella ornata]KAF2271548.1 hypothetical protein EI97DRAFT_453603 [Westerdykella ornata]
MARQSSTSSQMSQSLSDGNHKPAVHKAQRQHVVGQSRMQRNVSTGKNLHKLNKTTQAHAGDGNSRHHRRHPSGGKDPNSAPSSPRPGFKRNASTGGVIRAAHPQHTHAAIRKNHSSGHLARQVHHAKAALKSSRSEVAPPKRSLLQTSRTRESSPEGRPTVQFDVGDDEYEGADDGWTEESASQSPTTTRSNTRSNSVILEQQKAMGQAAAEPSAAAQPSQNQRQDISATQTLPDRTRHAHTANGGESHSHRSRPPDADVITSKLLQRSFSNLPTAQLSPAALTVVSETARREGRKEVKVLSHSTGSTLVDTPGRDLVSRFMDAGSSGGTPKGSSFLPSHNSPQGAGDGFDQVKRNKSMPNFAEAGASAKGPLRRSGTSTPDDPPYQSRTQQKLMLQRASSNIEPNKLLPAVLPRGVVPNGYVHAGMTFAASGEGRLDPRLQQQFNHVAVEYKVVRRYRNPLADAVLRIQQLPGVAEKIRKRESRSGKGLHAAANGTASTHGASSLSTSLNESSVEAADRGHSRRRSRMSFEGMEMGREEREGDGGGEGRLSYESQRSGIGGASSKVEAEMREMIRRRTEAEEVCRRLWESTEVVEGE